MMVENTDIIIKVLFELNKGVSFDDLKGLIDLNPFSFSRKKIIPLVERVLIRYTSTPEERISISYISKPIPRSNSKGYLSLSSGIYLIMCRKGILEQVDFAELLVENSSYKNPTSFQIYRQG